MGFIVVFTTSGCLHCVRLKKLLSNRNIEFQEVNIYHYPLYVDYLDQKISQRTVPQVFFNNDYIGGLEQVLRLLESGSLDPLAQEALQREIDDPDFPPSSTLKSVSLHIRLNVVIEDLYQQLRNGNFLKKGKVKFKASALINWLLKQGKEKNDALKLAQKLKDYGYIEDIKHPDKPFVNDNSPWQFSVDKDDSTLNSKLTRPPLHTGKTGETLVRDPHKIGHQLVVDLIILLEEYVGEKGEILVQSLVQDKSWLTFLDDLLELHTVDVTNLSFKEMTVFFTQIFFLLYHHALVMNALTNNCECYVGNGLEFKKIVSSYGYIIGTGGVKYTIQGIAYILRTGRFLGCFFSSLLLSLAPKVFGW
eukprot:TRINITY_DN3190_c0_g1_i5.p1 TRINITY_DN3190_c0_g1~~TRINITY_DN3190_c0_g1_i5.p1  ORF type:complete len:362 (+),score=69.90 TRINITY_DN3190_c0_g1_i5:491-1576(+)